MRFVHIPTTKKAQGPVKDDLDLNGLVISFAYGKMYGCGLCHQDDMNMHGTLAEH
jgi:hypothetical protein